MEDRRKAEIQPDSRKEVTDIMRKNKFLTIMVISMAIALFTGCGGEKNLKYTEYEYSDAAGFSVGEAVLNGREYGKLWF